MEDIIENFRFLNMEVENQVKLTYGLLSNYDVELHEKIASKDDYIDNLKTTVENACFTRIHTLGAVDRKKVNDVRAVHIICVNLERIADFCVNIARQTEYLSEMDAIRGYNYREMFEVIQKGLSTVSQVLDNRELAGALEICRAEYVLDQLYKVSFDRILAEMKKGSHITDLVTVLFIFRYLERIGDAILNIGEALIFAVIGDRIKIRQFDALQKTLGQSDFEGTFSDVDFDSIWGSRSGCRIGRVSRKNPSGFKSQGIFKEGVLKKIRKERDNITTWESIFPGLAPKVFGYHEETDTASLLVEFLGGCTMDQVVLTESTDVIRNVFYIFEQTVNDIWTKTRRPGPVKTDYMRQLKSRLEPVRRVHPDFFRESCAIESLDIRSTAALIETLSDIESELAAPFTVFIHGDFNTNNIIYNSLDQRINYIDLYRSRQADYVQDASVFLVSNFRLPVTNRELRERLNTVTLYFYEFFEDFAQRGGDQTFHVRMALALARSFYTSTRFELNRDFASEMFLRSHYLMERIAEHDGKSWETFRFREAVLFY